jgi:hypothetical protein
VLTGGNDNNSNNPVGRRNDVWQFKLVGSSVRNPVHTYPIPGIYNVSLQAYNSEGYRTIQKTGYIRVTNSTAPTKVGTFKNGAFYLDLDGDGAWNASVDKAFMWTTTGFTPLVGDWNGDAKSEFGTFNNGAYYLDIDGNGIWNATIDKAFVWTTTGFTQLAGKWS